MRILVVNQYFHPDVASTSQILTELCQDLAAHHQVTVVAGRPSYNPVESARRRGLVAEERLGPIRVLRTWSTSFARSSMAGRLTNYGSYLVSCLAGILRAERPDVVLTMTDPPLVAGAAMAASRVRAAPFVYVNQDVFPEVAVTLGKLREGPVAQGLRVLNRALRSSAAQVVAIGRDMRDRLIEQGVPSSRIQVIPNWADGSLVRPLDGPSPMRQLHDWNGRFVVMHSGNVGLSQSLETLISAADRLRAEPEVLIVIVGDGASKPRLEREARRRRLDNVTFLPYQPKTSLSESLGAADVHLVSLRRGLRGYIVPSKVYGIMAAGKPFIAAVEARSEVAMVVAEAGCGIRVDADDPGALANGIIEMRSRPLEEIGRRGRREFERRYERRIATEAYARLLEEVANNS